MTPFVVFSLPRSRSAWIARFLSYGGRCCGHDLATQCVSVAGFAGLFTSYAGAVETGAVIGWRAIRHVMPDAHFVVVRRPVHEVYRSLARFGLEGDELLQQLHERDAMLHALAHQAGVKSFWFDELTAVAACQDLFEFCLGIPFDWEWWEGLANVNVRINVSERIEYLQQNHERIERLKADARHIERQADVVIALEPWDSLWPEADALFAEHFAEVDGGDEPQRPYCLNDCAMREANHDGRLRIFTARVNGELAGYCMWHVIDDVESVGATFADHGPWFVLPRFAHLKLGVKLFDASIEDLRRAGVRTAYPHYRLRGRGAKLDAFFRRRGAIEIQRIYSLRLDQAHA